MAAPPFPVELQAYRSTVQSYVNAKVKQFAAAFNKRLNLNLAPMQLEACVQETMQGLASQEINTARALRLVLRHDCQSTGCGETGCLLCQYNPSRLCKRNIKNKYLIDDHLKAKCGAPLRVELVDETNACVVEGLPNGMQLECHVMNGEKYKEICPENTLLSHTQLRSCIIAHHTKALLRRDGGSDDQLRCFLQLERGQAVLSDLQVTTSSEALLAGKAPTFRLLIWAVDAMGEPVPSVTYVVSEYFVVATKRVKHAIKSDIPSVADHVSKLVHIGKATVDKLADLRAAAREEGFEINVPDELNRVDKVGQFQQLVELSEVNTELKNKVRHLLKLSPEKWEEVSNHAQAAVMPDFRPRAWWCPALKAGLLFSCKNGSVCMEQPIALVKMGGKNEEDQVIPIHQLDVQLFNTIPKLKAQAVQSWYAQSHPGWAIYWKEGQQDPTIAQAVQREQVAAGQPTIVVPSNSPQAILNNGGVSTRQMASPASDAATAAMGAFQGLPGLGMAGRTPTPPPIGVGASTAIAQLPSPVGTDKPNSPFHFTNGGASGVSASVVQLQPPAPLSGAPMTNGGASGSQSGNSLQGGSSKSPFAVPQLMGGLTDHFPQWTGDQQGGAGQQNPNAQPQSDSLGLSLLLNQVGNSVLPGLNPQQLGNTPIDGSRADDGLHTGLDRGMSQFNSLLGGENASLFQGGQLPISMLGPSGSLNAFMQDQLHTMERDPGQEPPTKMQRTMVAEEGRAS